jgi:hypothetical protein
MNRMSKQMRRDACGSEAIATACPACGAATRRADAHFCATCGRGLRERDYAPADSLFASYHQQRSRPAMLIERVLHHAAAQHASSNQRLDATRMSTAGSALLIVILTFVPFIGILLCPYAIVWGVVNLRHAGRIAPGATGGRTHFAVFNIVCGVLVLSVQLFLWLILYLLTK